MYFIPIWVICVMPRWDLQPRSSISMCCLDSIQKQETPTIRNVEHELLGSWNFPVAVPNPAVQCELPVRVLGAVCVPVSVEVSVASVAAPE